MLTSPSDSVSSLCSNSSPVAPSPHPRALFPSIPRRHAEKGRRAEKVRVPRYYATPLNEDTPDSTPLQMYGLEQREPSIAEKPKLLRRMSHALDDIKEDFSLQLEPRGASERLKSRNRQSTFMLDTNLGGSSGPGSSAASSSSLSGAESPNTSEPPRSRPMSVFSMDTWTPPARSLSRRLTNRLSFSQKKRFRPGQASISQPNLIGSSMHM